MMTALRRGLLILLAVLPMFSHAALTAHQVIQQTTDELLADLQGRNVLQVAEPSAPIGTVLPRPATHSGFIGRLRHWIASVTTHSGWRSIISSRKGPSASRMC